MKYPTLYRTVEIDGLSIFYREAGPNDGTNDRPTLLLLHGLPSSSRMFDPLFARLSDRYHLIAPDYPGFGHSDWPDPKQFAYTFDRYAEVMNRFTESARPRALHALHAGLRRPRRFSHGFGLP
jgi:pimeloyl-ACP methyl ester carboxylesterase